MSLISKIPIQSTLKKRRIPNAFMLFVKDQKERLVQKCPEESMTVIGTLLSKKWKAMGLDEKRVYYDKYNALKRHYEDSSALSSIKEEDSMDKDLIKEIREINKMEGIPLDRKQSKSSIKNPDDASDFTTVLENQPDNTTKYKNRSKTPSKSSKSKEGKRKSHGRTNPFLIFAKEQRGNIKSGKKSHVSTILGNMWHELDSSEKKKYFEKAKRPYSGNSEVVSSGVLMSDGKSKNKTKKKRGPKPVAHPQASENGISSSKDTAVIMDKSEKKENPLNTESTGVDPQHPSGSLQPDSKPCPHGVTPPQSLYNVLKLPHSQVDMNNVGVIPHHSPNIGGFYRPCFYPPNPMSGMPFWMYQQPMFAHHYYPFASYHSHCHCCPLPYHGYPGLGSSSHFRSVIYERTSAPYTSVSAAEASSDATSNDVHDEVSDDDENSLVIVDDVHPETGEHA